MSRIASGKLPASLLRELLLRHAPDDPRVLVGPGVGIDAAVIEMGDRLLVAATDPVTFATDEIGWYAVHVNANDVVCCGAVPRWFLATLLLSEDGTTPELVDAIFAQVADACRELGVSLCGGHTEITPGLDRPIVVGQMLGEVDGDHSLSARDAQVGDALILTKGIALEGTAIIARERSDRLRGVVTDRTLDRCGNWLHQPGISVVRDAQVALNVGGVHALHDPTEGGLATGLAELAEAAGVGLLIDAECVPLLPECRTLCDQLGLDPWGLIASGALLISASHDRAPAILHGLRSEGITATQIGRVLPRTQGCVVRSANGTVQPLPVFARDELTRLFDLS